ncbi:hypothetical protein GLOIN_2v1562571 [Rhizophagus clarus]|uniref:Myb/SANT-like DNA-binding domain-containing protein n=1 Tax=Rhizophagus clarus TaxID=94130 RepID=A0A8H3KQ59_9GLOM|nr:hypothetical protein GLOIN_2v1562571 [Rhizophagus clarus]
MDQYLLNNNFNAYFEESIHDEVHEENIYDKFYVGIRKEINGKSREEINKRVYGVKESSETQLSLSNYYVLSSMEQSIFPSDQDNNHQLINATHEIINRYSKLFENPQLLDAVNETTDKLREKNPFFLQFDDGNINLLPSAVRSNVTIGPCKWSEEATQDFFFYLEELKTFVVRLKTRHGNIKTKLWNHISAMLLKKGHNYSPKQCEYKWKNIQQTYKNWMRNSNNTTEFQYKSECERIFANPSGLNEFDMSLDKLIICNNSEFLNKVRPKKGDYTFVSFSPKKPIKGRRKNNQKANSAV